MCVYVCCMCAGTHVCVYLCIYALQHRMCVKASGWLSRLLEFGAQAHCVVWALRSQGIKNPRRRRGLSVGRYAHRAVNLTSSKKNCMLRQRRRFSLRWPSSGVGALSEVSRRLCSAPLMAGCATQPCPGLFRLKPCRTNLHELPQLPSQRNELVFPSAALLLCFEESSYQHVSAMSATWQTWQTTTSHAYSICKRVSVNRVAPTSRKNTRPLLLDWRTILPASGQQGRPRQSPH